MSERTSGRRELAEAGDGWCGDGVAVCVRGRVARRLRVGVESGERRFAVARAGKRLGSTG